MSDLGTQFAVLRALERHRGADADGRTSSRPTPDVLGAPFLVMEKVAGVCPSPWGREGRAFYAAAAARGVLPDSFTDALVAIHTVDWQAAGLDLLGVPEPGHGLRPPGDRQVAGADRRDRASSPTRSSPT